MTPASPKGRPDTHPSEPASPRRNRLLPASAKAHLDLLKEQTLLLASLVTIVGVASTDAYYSSMSLGYQFLDLAASHLLLRGITILATSPWLISLYLLAVLWLACNDCLVGSRPSLLPWRVSISHIVMVSFIAAAFPLAHLAGRRAAMRDLGPDSRLPRIARLTTADHDVDLSMGYRMLFSDGRTVVIFQPAGAIDSGALPKLRHFPASSISSLETLPNGM